VNAVAWAQRGITRYDESDRPALDAFQRDMFGTDAHQLAPGHFQWLFEEVPTPDPEGMQFWICKRNGAVVGQQGGIPFRLKVGTQLRGASWAIDLMVAPAWRLRGVGPALSETHAAVSEVSVGLGISDAAHRAYKSAGWIDLGGVPTYIRVIDPVQCVRVSHHDRALARAAALAGRPVVTAATMAFAGTAAARGLRLSEVERFDERVDALWPEASARFPVIAERSRDFLAWRFDRVPTAGRFRRFYLMQRGTPVGYLVLRQECWRGVPVGMVVDYLTKPGLSMAAFALLVEVARRDGMAALACRTLNPEIRKPLSMMGFLHKENGLNTPTRLMVRPGAAAQDDAAVLADRRNWFVTAADSDAGFKELGG